MRKKAPEALLSDNLFDREAQKRLLSSAPLSFRMRPRGLDEFVGQRHILGEGKLLSRAIASDRLGSLIFFGPPGTGKTTLAHCISKQTDCCFERINAVSSNVEDMRSIILAAKNRRVTSQRKTILFIDEIHRFNKAQQDVLMPELEDGNLILIGATVFNPTFALISPLISRSLVFEFKSLLQDDILTILKRALSDRERGLGKIKIDADEEALMFLAKTCEGDARRALNSLEIGCLTTEPQKDGSILFTVAEAQQSIQKKQILYDKKGDGHYDTSSAFIKSMRGSDPDAALYWMAKMLYAGEDSRFIARRICICAAEDVGNADPQALILASAALQISEFVGMPEARIPLAQAAVYVSAAPKSNASYMGIEKATEAVKNNRTEEVPDDLKGTYSATKHLLDKGKGYKYAHDYQGHFVDQEYIRMKERFYFPTDLGEEKAIKERLKKQQFSKREETPN